MWMEEDADKRLSYKRMEEIISTGVDCIASACPYCLSMFDDAVKAKEAEETMKAVDLSELVAAALVDGEASPEAKEEPAPEVEAAPEPEAKAEEAAPEAEEKPEEGEAKPEGE